MLFVKTGVYISNKKETVSSREVAGEFHLLLVLIENPGLCPSMCCSTGPRLLDNTFVMQGGGGEGGYNSLYS